jgi:shikimate dehydrogenase/3-dehydroquinate dehydratase type I
MTANNHDLSPRPHRRGYPLVVATLPGRTTEELRRDMGLAAEAGADLVEFRLDRLDPSEVPRLERVHEIPLMHEWVPAIATLRSRAEGGSGPDDVSARTALLEAALDALPFSYVDLEMRRDASLEEKFREWDGRPLGIVRSAHLPSETPTSEVLAALHAGLARRGLSKVVLPASPSRILSDLVPAIAPLSGRPFVLHTTGGAGGLLRVLAPRLGMAWVYCRLPSPPGGPRDVAPSAVEPSQIPADRMRRFVDAGPETPWFAVVGNPLGHTVSPDLHASFLERSGTGGIYIPLELASEEEFMRVLPQLPGLGLRGVNVTRPFKGAAFRLATSRTEGCEHVGAANALVPQAGSPSRFRAHNTDVEALERWWSELLDREPPPRPHRVLVLGAGGAARAAVVAATHLGLEVGVAARRPAESKALLSDLGLPSAQAVDRAGPATDPFPWVVNATPVGQDRGATLEAPLAGRLARGGLLIDLVYHPAEPTLHDLAKAAGARYVQGIPMLVFQAAASFELFTGRKAPPEAVTPWLSSGTSEVAA